MKHWGARKTIGFASVSVAFVFAAAVAWLLSKPPTYDCATDRSTDPQKIHATKVVVQPWLGRHQVFGIFMVPLLYRSGRTYSGRISVQSFNEEFIPDWHQIQWVEDLVVEPGYYLVQGYLPTRIALWFLFTGHFGDLLDPCNWTVEFVKRTP
jgi:hypothetical protein